MRVLNESEEPHPSLPRGAPVSALAEPRSAVSRCGIAVRDGPERIHLVDSLYAKEYQFVFLV